MENFHEMWKWQTLGQKKRSTKFLECSRTTSVGKQQRKHVVQCTHYCC